MRKLLFLILFILVTQVYSIQVVAPNGGEVWYVGDIEYVKWTYCEEMGGVDVMYSTTGSGGPWTTVARNVWAGDFQWPWTIPDTPSSNCFVRLHWYDGYYDAWDTSNRAFTIAQKKYIKVIKPNGGESWEVGSHQTVEWQCPNEGRVMI
ncbi:MAG: hypothetical protein JXA60_06410, partial [Candidatus Coatesbacteria bacterium]|nr:hypothetical protein [Candidatus Coatesbacteria bacterium]